MSVTEGIYRRVSVRLWTDERVRGLTPLQPSGQALWLYLITGPQTGPIPGVFVVGRAALAEMLDWEIEDFDGCLAELVREGLVRFDKATRLWFIPNALRHNPPASPNVVKGWRNAWKLLPEGAVREQIGAAILASLESSSKACAEAFAEVCCMASAKASAKASANPCPNQETGSRKQEEGPKPSVPTKVATDPEGFAEFWAAWPPTDRKQDRKKCAEKWKRSKLAQVLSQILAHLTAMKGTKKWREGYEPAPLKYLTGEHWNDGMPPVERALSPLHADDVFEAAR